MILHPPDVGPIDLDAPHVDLQRPIPMIDHAEHRHVGLPDKQLAHASRDPIRTHPRRKVERSG